jgi:hypothetical protein
MDREKLAEQIHQIYCNQYEKKNGKEYWTQGAYSLLDEETKDFDRAIADFILEDRKRIVAPLVSVKENTLHNFGRSGWIHHDNLLTKAIDKTLKLAGVNL